jgi:hypothetical protein
MPVPRNVERTFIEYRAACDCGVYDATVGTMAALLDSILDHFSKCGGTVQVVKHTTLVSTCYLGFVREGSVAPQG